MKRKTKEEIRGRPKEEHKIEIVKAEAEISQLRLQMATGQVKNTSLLSHRLDDLAVLLTLLREKESAI